MDTTPTRGEQTTLKARLEYERAKLKDKLSAGTSIIPPVVYKCGTCQDTGLVRYDREQTHAMFGKLEPCPDCGQRDNTEALQDTSGLMPGDYTRDWGDLRNLEGHNTGQAIRAVTQVLKLSSGWVYLYGDYGLGKTDILKTAVARAMKRGIHAIYIKAEYMLDNLRAALRNEEFDKLYNTYVKVPVLAIEEFEKINHTQWGDVRLFHLLDERWQRATSHDPKGVTLFASNVAPAQIDDGAIRSRLMDERFMVIKMTGKDVRSVSKELEL